MRLSTVERNVQIGATSEARRSQIAATPEMFRLLFDSLYSKKELAVVRELLCNAWDAHVEAGTAATPIEVHLPSYLEPWFQIKDYGVGLHPERVGPIYMDYGNSTKTGTNELIGGFGIGSKAPFAFTDSFTVTSRFEGTAYTFSAYIAEDGIPNCMLMGQDPTDEPNGLTVYVPVDVTGSIIVEFERAMSQFQHYLPTPAIVTGHELQEKPLEFDFNLEVDDIPGIKRIAAHLGKHGTYRQASLNIVQGIVPYPVDRYDIHDVVPYTDPASVRYLGQNANVTLWAEIGEFDVAGNREALSLTDKLKDKVRASYYAALKKIAAKAEDKINAADNWYEWAQACEITGFTPHSHQKPWKDVCNGASLTVAKLKEVHEGVYFRNVYSRDMSYKRGYRAHDYGYLTATRFGDCVVYTAPKRTHSAHRFAEQYFSQPQDKDLMVFDGTKAEVKAMLRHYGIPNEVKEVPYIAPPKANRAAFGKAQYVIHSLYHDGNSWGVRWDKKTATELLDEDFADDDALLIGAHELTVHRDGLNSGIVTLDTSTRIYAIDVPSHHSKVREALIEYVGERRIKCASEKIKWNQTKLDEVATRNAVRQKIGNNDLLFSDGALKFYRFFDTSLGLGKAGEHCEILRHYRDTTEAERHANRLNYGPDKPPAGQVDQLEVARVVKHRDALEAILSQVQIAFPKLHKELVNTARNPYYSNMNKNCLETINELMLALEKKQ